MSVVRVVLVRKAHVSLQFLTAKLQKMYLQSYLVMKLIFLFPNSKQHDTIRQLRMRCGACPVICQSSNDHSSVSDCKFFAAVFVSVMIKTRHRDKLFTLKRNPFDLLYRQFFGISQESGRQEPRLIEPRAHTRV